MDRILGRWRRREENGAVVATGGEIFFLGRHDMMYFSVIKVLLEILLRQFFLFKKKLKEIIFRLS